MRGIATDMLVLDASVTMAWFFPDESDPHADLALARMEHHEAAVPQVWRLEVRNCLLMSERRGRCAAQDAERFLSHLDALPIRADSRPDMERAYRLARGHGLTFYDAMYLELAMRHGAALASLDSHLVRAATVENLPPLAGIEA